MQKSALRCILGESYKSYEDALKKLDLVTLEERREQMCIKFAKGCLKLEKMKKLFPKNESNHSMEKRYPEFYKVVRAKTKRFDQSAIPSMVRMLNSYQRRKIESFKKIVRSTMPVNHVYYSPYHCDNNKL